MSDKENKTPITVKEEEIDLGKLFSLIGNAFSKLFNNIGLLLKVLFHYFILLLIFLCCLPIFTLANAPQKLFLTFSFSNFFWNTSE